MICHISLAQALLGLNAQIDTENDNAMMWRMKDTLTQKQINKQTHVDNMRVNDSHRV